MSPAVRILGVFALSFAALGASAAPAPAPATAVKFDVAAQPMEQALTDFAAQAALRIIFFPEVVKGLKGRKLEGSYTARDGLDRLLADSGLRYEFVNDRTVSIRSAKEGSGASGQTAAHQMRLAAVAEELRAQQEERDAKDLQQMVVKERRIEPFQTTNADIPRTEDDVQPYYIFDAETIQRSGAINVETFLKQRLSMNASAMSNSQDNGGDGSLMPGTQAQSFGNTSSINLRGLGANRTLVLVNGRRPAGVLSGSDTAAQADLNGIPVNAIERIEVMPSSASGIYGGSAMGGVINVILKNDYQGGEIRANYDNSWSGDSGRRDVSGSYGMSLEGGRTQLNLTARWAETTPLPLSARLKVYERNVEKALANAPGWFSRGTPWPVLGATPNFANTEGTYNSNYTVFTPTPLEFKAGGTLSSGITTITPGLSPSATDAEVRADLIANAGTYNTDLPDTAQYPNGIRRFLNAAPTNKSVMLNLRRQMTDSVEVFVSYDHLQNEAESAWNPYMQHFTLPAASPGNPFTTAIYMAIPVNTDSRNITGSTMRTLTAGLNARLPGRWIAQLDASISRGSFTSTFNSRYSGMDIPFGDGVPAPFFDTVTHGLDLSAHDVVHSYTSQQHQSAFALRGSGTVLSLPSGDARLTFGLEQGATHTPAYSDGEGGGWGYLTEFFARDQQTRSGYAELLVPLVTPGAIPGIHSLELQASGRAERFTVDTGTYWRQTFPLYDPSIVQYGGPTENGEPVFSDATYTSKNYTFGFKYQPVPEVTLRASLATAFLPPGPNQLTSNPEIQQWGGYLYSDPQNPAQQPGWVPAIGGGNPALLPENSESLNAGVIWQPRWAALQGLRFNLEYYRIDQFDSVAQPQAQTVVTHESLFPGRVTRDSGGAITLLDLSSVNQFFKQTQGVDLSVDYRSDLPRGRLELHLGVTRILHLRDQLDLALPMYEGAGYSPSEGGAPKHKGSLELVWNYGPLTAGWSTSVTDSYKQYGAAGGQVSLDAAGGAQYSYIINVQGSAEIPLQAYHDAFVSYSFADSRAAGSGVGSRLHGALEGASMTFGVRNVFDKVPPFDVMYSGTFYSSPYGDLRLRSYWMNFSKQF